MLCERVIGKVADDATEVDWVDIDYAQTTRRALRLKSRAGRAVNVLLPRGATLRHGDLLNESPPIAISVRPIPILVLRPTSLSQAMTLAALLGNQHLPLEFADDALLTPDDGPARQIAAELNISISVEPRRFHPSPLLPRVEWSVKR